MIILSFSIKNGTNLCETCILRTPHGFFAINDFRAPLTDFQGIPLLMPLGK